MCHVKLAISIKFSQLTEFASQPSFGSMKTYPSISRYRDDRHLGFTGDTFAKIDGSNLRFEWEAKRGWFRFGTRRRVINEDHETFGSALEMFESNFAEHFERLAVNKKWNGITVYCEFWGENSFAGEHDPQDEKFLTPIDVAIYKRGILEAAEFVKLFNDRFDLKYLGNLAWDQTFVERVRNSKYPGMAVEGVIGKTGSGHKRLAIKLKSKIWIEKVIQQYGAVKGQKILDS